MDHRLKKNSQFKYIFKKGERFSSDHFVLFVVKSKFETYRIGLSVSKKVGKANKRNKLKRRLREIFRKSNIKNNRNYVLMAKEGAAELSFEQIEREISLILKKQEKKENA